MQSQREIQRRYNKLLKDIETKDFYKIDLTNRINCYVCKYGHITKTKDVDPGVTPFMYTCETCGESARSTFYKDIAPDQKPTQEWFRPTLKQLLKMRKIEAKLDHILQGGLDIRSISN